MILPWGENWRLHAASILEMLYQFLASHSHDLYFKVVSEDTFGMEDTDELDGFIGASTAFASVLDIITASGLPLPLTKEASAEDREAVREVISAERELHFCNDSTDVDLSIFHPRWLWSMQLWWRLVWSLLRRPLRKLPPARPPSWRRLLQPLPLLEQRMLLRKASTSTKAFWILALLPVSLTKAPKLARMAPPAPGKTSCCHQLWLDIFMHQAKEGLPVPCTHLA